MTNHPRARHAVLGLCLAAYAAGCGAEPDIDKPDQFKAKLEEAGKAAAEGKASLKPAKKK